MNSKVTVSEMKEAGINTGRLFAITGLRWLLSAFIVICLYRHVPFWEWIGCAMMIVTLNIVSTTAGWAVAKQRIEDLSERTRTLLDRSISRLKELEARCDYLEKRNSDLQVDLFELCSICARHSPEAIAEWDDYRAQVRR